MTREEFKELYPDVTDSEFSIPEDFNKDILCKTYPLPESEK